MQTSNSELNMALQNHQKERTFFISMIIRTSGLMNINLSSKFIITDLTLQNKFKNEDIFNCYDIWYVKVLWVTEYECELEIT